MKHTIEKIDFDLAVKQKWSLNTCVLAQLDIRLHGSTTSESSWKINDADNRAEELRMIFDKHFRLPGDETKPELVALRESLPIEIEIP